jgi:hypothetical protein
MLDTTATDVTIRATAWTIVRRMLRAWRRSFAGIILGLAGSLAPIVTLEGQEDLTLRADLMLYGDNTEFHNPFREGETIFGAAIRPTVEVAMNSRVSVTLGALTNQRFGGDEAFELVRPVVSVTFRGAHQSFLIGTLPMRRFSTPEGPDRSTPHGLLPSLQRETLTFDRPYEAGLLWTVSAARWRHEAWINWQRLNTAAHRERFDTGVSGEWMANRVLSVPAQLHVVHEGGQLFAAGPVADSLAAAVGVRLSTRPWQSGQFSIETYGLVSHHVPDRETAGRTRDGAGFFGRVAAVRGAWRGHLLFWRGDDFIKDEGDPNYLSMTRGGIRYRGIRDYAEAGLTRAFAPARGVTFEASGRLHRIEDHYEYSYRLLCTTRLEWKLR